MTVETFDSRDRAQVPEDTPEELVSRFVARISEVSSLPDVAVRIVRLVDDPKTCADDLSTAVRSDPSLAMRVMRTVNSAYYALDKKVADLKQAVAILGFREVRSLALTAYIASLFRSAEGHGRYTRQGLWAHMVSCGMVARLIAESSGRVGPHEAYLAGLLHDLGLILMDQYAHAAFCRIVDEVAEDRPSIELEREVLGFDHAALGQAVAHAWHLPEHLAQAIGHHHAPENCPEEHRPLAAAVAVANFLCHRQDITPLGVANVGMPSAAAFAEVGVGKSELATVAQALEETLKAADVMALVQVR